jgi:ribonuclease R
VPIDSIRDDRYTWHENTHEIVGSRGGRIFRAGDRVTVVLDRILADERKLQFSLVDEGMQLSGKPAPRPKKARAKAKSNAKAAARASAPKPPVKKIKKKHGARKGKRR